MSPGFGCALLVGVGALAFGLGAYLAQLAHNVRKEQ